MVSPSSRGFLGLDYGDFFVAQTTASEGIDESGCETIPNRIFVGGIAFRVSAREDTSRHSSRRGEMERRVSRAVRVHLTSDTVFDVRRQQSSN